MRSIMPAARFRPPGRSSTLVITVSVTSVEG